jgi:hypothetical protein
MDETQKQVIDALKGRLRENVGLSWMILVSPKKVDAFLVWALEGQVYSLPGNEQSLGDAFRGFVTGCLIGK